MVLLEASNGTFYPLAEVTGFFFTVILSAYCHPERSEGSMFKGVNSRLWGTRPPAVIPSLRSEPALREAKG
jgi:hypothetical protein